MSIYVNQYKTCIFHKADPIKLSPTVLSKANVNRAKTSPISAHCSTFTHFSCRNKIRLRNVPLISDEVRSGDGVRNSKQDCHVRVNLLNYVTGRYK